MLASLSFPRLVRLLPISQVNFHMVLLVTIHLVQTYVTNLNAQMDKFPELKDLGLVTLNQSLGSSKIPKEAATAVR